MKRTKISSKGVINLKELTYEAFDSISNSFVVSSLNKRAKPTYKTFTIRLDNDHIVDLELLKDKMGNVSYSDVVRSCLRKEADYVRSYSHSKRPVFQLSNKERNQNK